MEEGCFLNPNYTKIRACPSYLGSGYCYSLFTAPATPGAIKELKQKQYPSRRRTHQSPNWPKKRHLKAQIARATA
jgi:hypothetical protein